MPGTAAVTSSPSLRASFNQLRQNVLDFERLPRMDQMRRAGDMLAQQLAFMKLLVDAIDNLERRLQA